MNSNISEESVPDSKVRVLRNFERMGYKVICMIDDERSNLAKIKKDFSTNEDVLLLHASTIFISKFEEQINLIISGKDYNIAKFV